MLLEYPAAFRPSPFCNRQLISVPLTDCGKKTAEIYFVRHLFYFAGRKLTTGLFWL